MTQLVYFDKRVTALQQELMNHPELLKRMAQAKQNAIDLHKRVFEEPNLNPQEVDTIADGPEELGYIAAYLGIYLDGQYLLEDLYKLCWELRKRLIERRTVYINSDTVSEEEQKPKILLTPHDLPTTFDDGVEPAFKFDETGESEES